MSPRRLSKYCSEFRDRHDRMRVRFRRAAARRMAEAECTPHEIRAVAAIAPWQRWRAPLRLPIALRWRTAAFKSY